MREAFFANSDWWVLVVAGVGGGGGGPAGPPFVEVDPPCARASERERQNPKHEGKSE